MIANIERIISDFLRDQDAFIALDARPVAKTPDSTARPWVRVTQLDAANEARSRPEHLLSYLVQLDCYAGSDNGQPEANLLGRTVRLLLHDELPGVHDDVVVTSVRFVGMARIPDVAYEPARERIVLTADIRAHT